MCKFTHTHSDKASMFFMCKFTHKDSDKFSVKFRKIRKFGDYKLRKSVQSYDLYGICIIFSMSTVRIKSNRFKKYPETATAIRFGSLYRYSSMLVF